MMRRALPAAALLLAPVASPLSAQSRQPFTPSDLPAVVTVAEPALSPDGAWIAYTVTTADTAYDHEDADVWMVSWDGARQVRVTSTPATEHAPRWSPDGRWLAFLSPRGDAHDAAQLWLLDRRGGEAEKVTSLPGGVSDYAWSPDGTRIALIAADAPAEVRRAPDGKERGKAPIVIDRYKFKLDGSGYLDRARHHLYRLDVGTKKATLLLPGDDDEALPSWSPDGTRIAFASRRGRDADRTLDWNVWVVAPDSGAVPVAVTTDPGADAEEDWGARPAWSPDGTRLAYPRTTPARLIYYATQHLAVSPAAGGEARVLTTALDRNVDHPQWTADGGAVMALVTDDGVVRLDRIDAATGAVRTLVGGRRVVTAFDAGADERIVVAAGTSSRPPELFAVEPGGALRQLTRHNAAAVARFGFDSLVPITARSRDGTIVHGFVLPARGWVPGERPAGVVRIHGGPVAQYQHEFDEQWQVLSSAGYTVIGANPRGSSGRGEAYAAAIHADWGNLDAADVLAIADEAVRLGYADGARLGVGGWSYGGILTDFLIGQTNRFKAATSGAGSGNPFATYGTDQYVVEYDLELGAPWENPATYTKLARPFLQADRIRTPTLFLCGDADFNVPLLNSEQMYQALRRLGVPTRLVVYPGATHAITTPSHARDRLERYLDWYGRYLR